MSLYKPASGTTKGMGLNRRTTQLTRKADDCAQTKLFGKKRLKNASVSRRDVGDSLPVLGLLACAVLAVLLPRLHNIPLEVVKDGICNAETAGGHPASDANIDRVADWTRRDSQQRKDNATVEATLEAAVMGAFLADAASLGFQGYVPVAQQSKRNL